MVAHPFQGVHQVHTLKKVLASSFGSTIENLALDTMPTELPLCIMTQQPIRTSWETTARHAWNIKLWTSHFILKGWKTMTETSATESFYFEPCFRSQSSFSWKCNLGPDVVLTAVLLVSTGERASVLLYVAVRYHDLLFLCLFFNLITTVCMTSQPIPIALGGEVWSWKPSNLTLQWKGTKTNKAVMHILATLLCVFPSRLSKTHPPVFHTTSCVCLFVCLLLWSSVSLSLPGRISGFGSSVCICSFCVDLFQALRGGKLWCFIGQTFFGTSWMFETLSVQPVCVFVSFFFYRSVCSIVASWSRSRCKREENGADCVKINEN